MRIANHVFDDQTAYDNSEERSHRICHCDRVSLIESIYNASRKDGDGQYGTDDVTDNLALSAASAIDAFDGGRRTLFLRRKTSGSQEYCNGENEWTRLACLKINRYLAKIPPCDDFAGLKGWTTISTRL